MNHSFSKTAVRAGLSAALLFNAGGVGSAAVTVEDAFATGGVPNYVAGIGNLVAQGPARVGFTGNWLPAYGGAQSPSVLEAGLAYSDGTDSLVASGGSVNFAGAGNGRAGRLLNNPVTNSTASTVYLAFLMQLESTAVSSNYRGFELHSGGFDDGGNRRLQIVTGEPGVGVSDGNVVLRLFNNTAGFSVDLGAPDTNVNLFVVKFTFGSAPGTDAVEVWRNPADLSSEPLSGVPNANLTGFDMQFDRVSFARFGNEGLSFDEVRFGTSWSDVTTVSDGEDADADGLPDAWEMANSLSTNDNGSIDVNNGPAGDPDMDDSSNLQEFGRGTNPRNRDTDNDGLSDGSEDDGGVYVSAAETGTNPLNPDSDSDGLKDGVETATLVFVDAGNTGTDPNKADTDLDGTTDGFEVTLGSDPTTNASTPANASALLCNGYREDLYGDALAVQNVQTEFGDNLSELDAAYAKVVDGKLFLMLTGNLEDNFNKLNIFIDSTGAVTSNILNAAGNDGSDVMDGMVFDAGVSPDYHIIIRRGEGVGPQFDLDIAELSTGKFAAYSNLFSGAKEGFGVTVPNGGTLTTGPIGVGYFDLNKGGILGGTGAADSIAAQDVRTGLELCIDLADLGNPSATSIKVAAFVTSSDLTFTSNQFLGGLGAGFGNLGTTNVIDLSTFAGDQFFPVEVSNQSGIISIDDLVLLGANLSLTASGLIPNVEYHVEFSSDLSETEPFAAVPGSTFLASAVSESTTFVVPGSKGFVRIVRGAE